jgi:uncharacterized protein (DUF2336 family)
LTPKLEVIAPDDAPEQAPTERARETLSKRLADIVCLPASRITPAERHMAADLLVDVLCESPVSFRMRCARRIATLPEAPSSVLRWLGVDEPAIAEAVILRSEALSDADLAAIARTGSMEHRALVANRREVSALLSEGIVEREEPAVIEVLLANPGCILSDASVDRIVRVSRDSPRLARPLSRRPELRPNQGLTLFWWSDPETRKQLILRFGVERHLIQDAVTDVYAMAAAARWQDPVSRKALQFIERRQRNRAALERSPYASLEEAIEVAAKKNLTRRGVEEISYLSGIKPATGAKIFTDLGGEPIAVLCKATGLKRSSLDGLWAALRRPISLEGRPDATYEHVVDVYESLATDKAQTVLRYWNWALTSAVTPALAMAEDADESLREGHVSAAHRSSRLVWGAEFNPHRS